MYIYQSEQLHELDIYPSKNRHILIINFTHICYPIEYKADEISSKDRLLRRGRWCTNRIANQPSGQVVILENMWS